MSVMRLGFVQARETDIEKATAYYTNVLGLQEVARQDGKRYFKGWDEYDHHSVVIENGGLGLVKMGYKVESQDELASLEKAIEAFGLPVRRVAKGENLGLGQAIRCTLPSEHVLELYAECEQSGTRVGTLNPDPWPTEQTGIAASRLDHLLVTAEDVKTNADFFTRVLGFRMSERIITDAKSEEMLASFLFCSNKAHDIAFVKGPNGKLHHFAFWLDSWGDILRAGDILSRNNVKIDFGPARHGITRGTTIYFFGPNGNRNEVFSGGYMSYPDFPCITWTADQIGKAIFYIHQEVNERFSTYTT
ncbi:MAG: catechol 2,3-dioxygenase [Deltaproteobacteria bacterium]|nr:catechol 2,3-dioxygenase [Deltaproteobacteria bacterium]